MELLKNPHFDFLGKKAWFIGLSVIVILAGLLSYGLRGIPLGIDFRGGADVLLKFRETPSEERVRTELDAAGFGGATVQRIGDFEDNELLIRLNPAEGVEAEDLAAQVLAALRTAESEPAGSGRIDVNVAGREEISASIVAALGVGASSEADLAAAAIVRERDQRGGLIQDAASLKSLPEITPAIGGWVDSSVTAGRFAIRSIDYVGPAVGSDLRKKARLAVLLSLVAMLVYIAFRFHAPAYGISAIITLGHDVLVTLGFISFFQKEFDLTVLAAVLTIVGYSINDTIVIFDRVRENLRLHRQTDIEKVFNDSINQTLSRTLLTNLLVFMVLLSIWIFGGPRLEPFSFALLVGSVSGTYSTIYIASPIVVWWTRRKDKSSAKA